MTMIPAPVRFAAAALVSLCLLAAPAAAFEIKEVTSPGGIKAWLVEDHTIPLVAMDFGFKGGTAADPEGKEGLAYFLSGMLDEGAGDLDSQAFKKRAQDLGLRLSFSADRDDFEGSVRVLSQNLDESFELLRLSLTKTRFDAEPVERVRGQILLNVAEEEQDPDTVTSRAAMRAAFPGHPYSRLSHGTAASLKSLTADDLKSLQQRLFARDNLLVAVVGDIDAAQLGQMLDRVFGGLPAKSAMPAIAEAEPKSGPAVEVIGRDIPQSSILLTLPGIRRADPDFVPAFVMNSILGGSSFGSRIMTEVREKRGLSYHAGSQLWPLDEAGILILSAATRNDRVSETISVMQAELKRMADEGPTPEELAAIKTYLTGSYALRFDTSGGIAGQLLGIQQQKLGIDYISKRNGLIEAVTLEDCRRVARRLLAAAPLVTITGRPEGITTQTPPG